MDITEKKMDLIDREEITAALSRMPQRQRTNCGPLYY
jgi:hypothetical protein